MGGMERTALLQRRLSSIALTGYANSNISMGGTSVGTRTPPSGSGGRSPTPRSGVALFNEWEDDEHQRHGCAFELVEEEEAALPLVPRRGPVGWVDDGDFLVVPPAMQGRCGFVEANWFRLLVGMVILGNALVLATAMARPSLGATVDALGDVFLFLYCAELSLRIAHYRSSFFVMLPEAPWNWVDLVIVFSGVMDEWVLPLIHCDARSSEALKLIRCNGGNSQAFLGLRILQPLRFLLRAVRLLRLVRLVRVLIIVDLKWVESSGFQSAVGLVIVLNAVIMGLETDLQSPWWWWVEQALLGFFVTELAFRLRLRGCNYFTDPEDRGWNILDLVIVLSGAFDQWLLEMWHGLTQTKRSGSNFGQMMMLARMLRLMRILRLVRVVKAIRPLRQLAIGVVRAMQSMFWVLVLTFVALYSLAILTTRMIGWGQLVDDPETIPEETREMFGSMVDSMFTLFAFMNGHEWHKVTPLLDLLPWTKPLFVAFTICGSWALLSVMTGVVSDHIQYVREQQQREDEEAREERREQLTMTLSQIFASADKDGRGYLSRDAYMEIFNSPYQVRRLQRALNQPLADVQRIFDWLDVEGRGAIGFREFCEGLDFLEETVTGQRLLKVDSGVKLQCRMLQRGIDEVTAETDALRATMQAQRRELMQRIREVLGPQEEMSPIASGNSFRSEPASSYNATPLHTPPELGEAAATGEPTAPEPPRSPQGKLRYQRSQSSLRSAGTRTGSELASSFSQPVTPPEVGEAMGTPELVPAEPLRSPPGKLRYQRSLSSLRSVGSTGAQQRLRLQKSVSFSELPPEEA